MNKKIIMMVLAAAVTVSVFAHDSDIKGKDIVQDGKLEAVSGTLSLDDGEWILTAGKAMYNLHLGNIDVIFPDGVPFKDGDKADVRGFVLKEDIAAVDVTVDGKKASFRDDSGRPLWAGRGNRENERTADARYGTRGGAMGGRMMDRQAAPHGRAAPNTRDVPYGRAAPNTRDVPYGRAAPNARDVPYGRAAPNGSYMPRYR